MILSHSNYSFLKFSLYYIKIWLYNSGLKRETFNIPSIKQDAFLVIV